VPAALGFHLAMYLGLWPPRRPVDVVSWPGRAEPAWDGGAVPVVAVRSPRGTMVSVRPDLAGAIAPVVTSGRPGALDEDLAAVGSAFGRVSPWVVLRWSSSPAPLGDVGRWVGTDHRALPEWLGAFAGPVLVAFDPDGRYLAGVGAKVHTHWGRELAVGTDEAARGQGLARRLVAQAARSVLADGGVPLYVHAADNTPSARVADGVLSATRADAAGFPDRGWRLRVVWGTEAEPPG
jgi:GNAT superfamily N-acetyltransferase